MCGTLSGSSGGLIVCATPIGNLDDVTTRVISALRDCDLIAAEDTRRTRKLTSRFDISTSMTSYNKDNEHTKASYLIQKMQGGMRLTLVSDGGMPGISDPGHTLIQGCIEADVHVQVLPGASAAVTALVASGLPTDSYFFQGFLPRKSGERKEMISRLSGLTSTLVFYEAPHRIKAGLADLLEVLGDRSAAIAREMTKVYEEVIRGSLSELLDVATNRELKGEMVLLVGGAARETEEPLSDNRLLAAHLLFSALLDRGEQRRSAAKAVAGEFGLSSRDVYSWTEDN